MDQDLLRMLSTTGLAVFTSICNCNCIYSCIMSICNCIYSCIYKYLLYTYSGVVSGVNYSAQQHAEQKVPSVAKYVHVCSMKAQLQGYLFALACH